MELQTKQEIKRSKAFTFSVVANNVIVVPIPGLVGDHSAPDGPSRCPDLLGVVAGVHGKTEK